MLTFGLMGRFNRDNRSGSGKDHGRRDYGRGRSFGNRGGEREMHKVICSNCGKACEVPFKPTESKPVYCNECFRRDNRSSDRGDFRDRLPRRTNFENRHEPNLALDKQFQMVNQKLDKLLNILTGTQKNEEEKIEEKSEEIAIFPKKKKRASKKKTPEKGE